MLKLYLKAKYPLIGTKDFIEISIGQPELDPKSPNDDRRCECKISGPNYEKKFYVYGIDEIQCVWIGLRQIRVEIAEFEKKTNMKCEYVYFQDFEK
ncbi:MAG: hypothetical protein WC070_03545 [Candidatus Magasanikbacteria bacterium]